MRRSICLKSSILFCIFLLGSTNAKAASVKYVGTIRGPQVASTNAAVSLNKTTITQMLNEKSVANGAAYSSAFTVSVLFPNGKSVDMDSMKVIQTTDSAHPYLAVFHQLDSANSLLYNSYLASSSDLKSWTFIGQIHHAAGMPDIRILQDNSVLLAEELNPTGNRPFIGLTYYKNANGVTGLDRFIKNPSVSDSTTLQYTGIQTPGALADGTPELSSIKYVGDITKSQIFLTRHVWKTEATADTEALGIVNNFSSFQDLGLDTAANDAIQGAGGTAQHGGRSLFAVGQTVYEVIEANSVSQNFGTWSIYLLERDANLSIKSTTRLAAAVSGGATSMGNPHVSFVSLPNGHLAFVSTKFIFSENSGTTGNGNHLYVYDLGGYALDSALVFDASWYLAKYPDLKKAFGSNTAKATMHWLSNGIAEGRDGNASFSIQSYLSQQADLKTKFGTNYRGALQYYILNSK